MTQQASFVDLEIESKPKTRKTKLERVTDRLEKLVPWEPILEMIRPHYFVSGRRGRQPYDLKLMLRIHILQITYNLSDPEMEDFLQENFAARRFVGLSLRDRTPDESTILLFRHFLEQNNFGQKVFSLVNANISKEGLKLVKGRIVDASFVEAPSSTKNKDNARDPEMASGKKAETWHFGMKMHVATDHVVGIVTDVAYSPANDHDVIHAREIIPDDATEVYGDSGYRGMGKREEFEDLNGASYRIACRPGKLKKMPKDSILRKIEKNKASIRCKVEHVFKRIKLDMGYSKVRYRGISKNAHRINSLLAMANLFCFDCWRVRHMG